MEAEAVPKVDDNDTGIEEEKELGKEIKKREDTEKVTNFGEKYLKRLIESLSDSNINTTSDLCRILAVSNETIQS